MSQQQRQPQQQLPLNTAATDGTTTIPVARNDPSLILRTSPPLPFPVADSIRGTARVATRVYSKRYNNGAGGTNVIQNVLIPADPRPPRGDEMDSDTSSSSTDTEEDEEGEGMEGVQLEEGADAAEATASARQQPRKRAYWLQRVIRDAIYGRVWAGVILLSRTPPPPSSPRPHPYPEAEWEISNERVAIKEMEWGRIRQHRGRLAENPINEVGALQFLMEIRAASAEQAEMEAAAATATGAAGGMAAAGGAVGGGVGVIGGGVAMDPQAARERLEEEEEARHVSIPLDMLSDERNLYVVSSFCNGGELFDLLEGAEKFTEDEARHWMRQILLGIGHLQRVGISHRDLSLENLLVHDRRCIVIDLGMCLRVPFERQQTMPQSQPENGNAARTVNVRRRRRYLIPPQGTCGKWHYMSPEINANRDPFDGYAVDLWAAGVILFLMLTGFPPWEKACDSDDRFRYMSRGYMAQLLTEWQTGLTAEAMDLLQRMLYKDPSRRLTLSQVREHRWMTMAGVARGGGGGAAETMYGGVPDRPFA